MADASVIKEFLASLGFKIDEASHTKFTRGLESATKMASKLGVELLAAAAAVNLGVNRITNNLEDLYFASQRIGASVGNIKAYQYAVSRMGGTVEGARGSLEGFAHFLRYNPGASNFLNGLGVATKNANGEVRDTTDVMEDFIDVLRKKPANLQLGFAQAVGMDEMTLQAMLRGTRTFSDQYRAQLKASGVDMDKAAKSAHEFNNSVGALQARFDVIGTQIANRFIPLLEWINKALEKATIWFFKLDDATGGWSTVLGTLAVVVAGVAGAIALFTGGIGGLITAVAAVATAVAAAVAAIGLVPIAIGAAVLAVGLFAIDIVKHWDNLPAYFEGIWDKIVKVFQAGGKAIAPFINWFLGNPDNAPSATPATTTKPPAKPKPKAGAEGVSPPPAAANSNIPPVTTDPEISTIPTARQVMTAFQGMGWTLAQSAGIAASLWRESNFDSTMKQKGGGPGYGLGQWEGPRQADFKQWAGFDIHDPRATWQVQAAFLNHEMREGTRKYGGSKLMGATDAADAGSIVSRLVEGPKAVDSEARARGDLASEYFNKATLGGEGGGGVSQSNTNNITVNGVADPDRAAARVGEAVQTSNDKNTRNLRTAAQ